MDQIEAGAAGPPVELVAEDVGELTRGLTHEALGVDQRDRVGRAL